MIYNGQLLLDPIGRPLNLEGSDFFLWNGSDEALLNLGSLLSDFR